MPDVLLDGRDLPNLTGEGVRIISGAQEAAQHVSEALQSPLGSFPWNRAAGSQFPRYLNAHANREEILAEMRRVTIEVPGVLAQTVEATYDEQADEPWMVVFQHESSDRPIAVTVST